MKIKIASIALALIFVAFSSFKNDYHENSANAGVFKWFEYNGYGDPTNPASYTMVMFEPECNSTLELCAVYAECDFWGWHPTSNSLFTLAISSCYFTQSYVGGYGQVTLKGW